MKPKDPVRPRTRKSKPPVGPLGQFRVLSVAEDPPVVPMLVDTPDLASAAWWSQVTTSPWFDPEKEHLIVFVLTTRLVLKGWNVVSVGSVNETLFHPREVLRPVLVAAGSAFVLLHNHPSGDPSPSHADQAVTRRLMEAATLMQIQFLDHVIIGSKGRHFSFREAGLV